MSLSSDCLVLNDLEPLHPATYSFGSLKNARQFPARSHGNFARAPAAHRRRYFKLHGTPKAPHELLEHECIRQRLNRTRCFELEFRVGGKDVTIGVSGRLILDEMRAILGAACQGSGLALVFRQFAAAEITSGAVVPILDKCLPPDDPFHLHYANRAHTPRQLRAFIGFMQTVNRKVPK